jgi:tetratricopeptide (TPR) repeat protein
LAHAASCPAERRDLNFAEAHNNLGLVLLQAGDVSGAQAEFIEAVRLNRRYAEAHYNLALALHQEGKEEEFRAEFERAYEIAPGLRNMPRP